MPSRILKESICESETLAKIGWFEQVLFFRLIVLADDYGCYDARTKIIRGRAFPLDNVTEKMVSDGIRSLGSAGLVDLYTVGGKPILHLRTWEDHQRVRDSKHKYPTPDEADCSESPQVAASCGELPQVAARTCAPAQRRNPNPNPNPNPDIPPLPPKGELDRQIDRFLAYRREQHKPLGNTGVDALRKKLAAYPEKTAIAMLEQSIANGWQGVFPLDEKKAPKKDYSRTAISDEALEELLFQHDDDIL